MHYRAHPMSTPPPPPGFPGQQPPPPGFPTPPPQGYPTPPPQQYGAPPPGYQPYPQQGYGGYQPAASAPYAGWGTRLGAYILDGLISVVFAIPGIVALFAGPRHYVDCDVDGESGICRAPTGATIGIAVILFLAGLIAYLVIYCKKVGSGQSWGQSALNIRVVDKNTGQPIGTGRAVGRYFGRIISGAVCYLGFLWPLWDKEKQAWHDKMVNSIVIKTQ
jgi:uncharacterized RDD family membrane protein YckC